MRKNSLLVIVVVLAVLFGIGASLRGDGGRVTKWLASLHGSGGH
jgi:hypothetical protein